MFGIQRVKVLFNGKIRHFVSYSNYLNLFNFYFESTPYAVKVIFNGLVRRFRSYFNYFKLIAFKCLLEAAGSS